MVQKFKVPKEDSAQSFYSELTARGDTWNILLQSDEAFVNTVGAGNAS